MKGRIPHVITKGKNKERPQNVIYCDSESRPDPVTLVHTPYLMCAYFCRYKKKKTEYKKAYQNDVKPFWYDVCDFAQYKTVTYVYAHNMGYDLIATGAIPALEDNDFRLKSFFEKGGTLIYRFEHHEYNENEEPIEGKTKTIILLSSTNFYAEKLSKIAPVFGLEKIDIEKEYGANYVNIPIEQSIEYCYQDVKIVKVAMEALFEFVDREDLGTVGKTAASQAFNAFRHRFMQDEIFIHNNAKSLELERLAYYGGRVECWHIGECTDDTFYYIDVNSMYPYVMANFTYPVRLLNYARHNSIEDLKTAIAYGDGVIAKVKIKTNEPYFPLRKDNKLIFPIGEFTTYLATAEVKFAVEHNLIKKVYECSYFEMKPIFKEFIDYFYNARLEAKKNKDDVHSLLYKLMMNCLYGKFGQLAENWEEVGEAPYGMVRHELLMDYDTKEMQEIKIFGGTIFARTKVTESFNSFPAIAAHVTSQARIHLLNHIIKAKKENVLYMDTDSLFCRSAGFDNLENYLSNTELGKMKVEEIGDYVKINAPKDYYFRSNTIIKKDTDDHTINNKGEKVYFLQKRKGISKDARPLTDEEFENYLLDQKNKLSKEKYREFLDTTIREELTVNLQWPKMSTFLNEGQLSSFHNVNRIKKLSRKYNKGKVLKNGDVIPFEIYE